MCQKGGFKKILFLLLASIAIATQLVLPASAKRDWPEQSFGKWGKYSTTIKSVGDLTFSVRFYDRQYETPGYFGPVGTVENKNTTEDIKYSAKIYYYNTQGKTLAIDTITQTVPRGQKIPFEVDSEEADVISGYDSTKMSGFSIVVTTYEAGEEVDVDISEEVADMIWTNNTPSNREDYGKYEYVLDAYDVDIEVHDDNTFDVVETITANFFTKKHGIIRKLPLNTTLVRADGSTSSLHSRVSNISVDDEYKVTRENGYINLKIGSATKTITGTKKYTIRYTYNFGLDHNDKFDEFYFNIIGDQWDTAIGNISFRIEMPKDFDASKLGFSSGRKGTVGSDSVYYVVNGNEIMGKYNGILLPNEALTARVELEEGYFANAKLPYSPEEYLIYVIPIGCALFVFMLWLIFGNDPKTVETVEFYPPEGLNSIDVAQIYHGRVHEDDVISLLFVLANKGYIRIVENEESEKTFGIQKSEFVIQKIKEYDGGNEYEELFMKGLFRSGQTTVSIDSLENKFYRTIDKILNKANSKDNRSKYYTNTTPVRVLNIIAIIVTILALFIIPIFGGGQVNIIGILFVLIVYSPFYIACFTSKISIIPRLIMLGFIVLHSSLMLSSFVDLSSILSGEIFYTVAAVVGAVCIFVMIMFYRYMPKRKADANELYGRIKGLRNYMATAEKDRMEMMLASDANYAYALIPYAMVLGVSAKWFKKFDALALRQPDWYVSDRPISSSHISTSVRRITHSASSSLDSRPSSSGGGGGGGFSSGGGGGSSGGGGGGGGGSSW